MGVAEPNNAQNSLDGCVDGNSGVYTDDESIEVIEVSASGGGLLQVGKGAVIKANIYAWGTGSSSYADFYFKDMNGPNTDWTYIATRSPSGGNAQEVVSPTFVLTSTQMAVRVNLRYNGNPSPCSGGNYDEADDLVFAVAAGPSSSPSGQPTQSAQPSQSATPTNVSTPVWIDSIDLAFCEAGRFMTNGQLLFHRHHLRPPLLLRQRFPPRLHLTNQARRMLRRLDL